MIQMTINNEDCSATLDFFIGSDDDIIIHFDDETEDGFCEFIITQKQFKRLVNFINCTIKERNETKKENNE